uniref:SWIM-type domain-containing protein n=1 Tax=Cannabis sativa TaxID=3483 RepID=A0A803QBY7_CANSA
MYNSGRWPNGERGGDVNLVERTCIYVMFTLLKLPCTHACFATLKMNTSVYILCSPYYSKDKWRKTYDDTINLVGDKDDSVLPKHIKNMKVGVPVEKKPIGHPRKRKAGRR